MPTHRLTRATHERLVAEHRDLTTRGRIEVAERIARARELGDLKENGDYHAAKDEQGHMEGRIRHLEAMLEDVEIVEPATGRAFGRLAASGAADVDAAHAAAARAFPAWRDRGAAARADALERLAGLIAAKADRTGATAAEVRGEMAAEVPLRRIGRPEEIARAVAFLCSPAAAYISGINLPVDGGRTACL